MADQMSKVRGCGERSRRHGGEVWVQVDGGVRAETIEVCAEAGADVFVAGSAVYGRSPPRTPWTRCARW